MPAITSVVEQCYILGYFSRHSLREAPTAVTNGLSSNRVLATFCIWCIAAGLAGLVWLTTLNPFTGLPVSHPINFVLFGLCAAIGLGFIASVWLRRPEQ
jgi:hypothetical protein